MKFFVPLFVAIAVLFASQCTQHLQAADCPNGACAPKQASKAAHVRTLLKRRCCGRRCNCR